jgi:hypothetical protein
LNKNFLSPGVNQIRTPKPILSMKNVKKVFLLLVAVASLTLTGCLHIVEEVTVKKDGSGSYSMELDMSEMKGMMDMLKGMDGMDTDSTAIAEDNEEMGMGEDDPSMAMLGNEISQVAGSLVGIPGLSNIEEVNDTSTFKFGYKFDFANVDALNAALRAIHKEKYEGQGGDVFSFSGKKFERKEEGDLSKEIQQALAEGDEGEEGMEMVKMFFADMSYKQIYHFPDRTIKKSSNGLSELSDNDHTLTITIKPFDEEQMAGKPSVGTQVKLK